MRPYQDAEAEAIVRLSLRAWAPVFASLQQAMQPEVYQSLYPEGWRPANGTAVRAVCTDPEQHVWVAERGNGPVEFVAIRLHTEDALGEIYMVAVIRGTG